MTIKITQKDIDKGERGGSCNGCAVARAASRAFGKPVAVGNIWAIEASTCRRLFSIPISMRWWQNCFDIGLEVKPVEFEVEVSD